MSMVPADLDRLAFERSWTDYIADLRTGTRQQASFSERDNRYTTLDALSRGDWAAALSETFAGARLPPYIKNPVSTGLDDYARLSSAAVPTVACRPLTTKRKEGDSAQIREAIALTHARYNRIAQDFRPALAYDLAGYGAAYVMCWPDLTKVGSGPYDYECPYPRWTRIDPRTAYPTFDGGRLLDLVVCNKMLRRQAAMQFPSLGLDEEPHGSDTVEIIDYYSKTVVAKVVSGLSGGGALAGRKYLADIQPNWLGVVPVAFAKLHTLDGHIRGLFDQVGAPTMVYNTMMAYGLTGMEKVALAPSVYKGILNPQDEGRNAKLFADEDVQGSGVTRVEPQRITAEFFGLMGQLREDIHGAIGVAPQRGGQNLPSIISAAGISAVSGVESTNVEYIQSHLASIEQQLYEIGFLVDETYMNFPKPLLHPSTKDSYVPSEDIAGRCYVQVSYGFGSGMAPENKATLLYQAAGTGFFSREYSRSQMPGMSEGYLEESRIEREQNRTVVWQRIFSESPLDTVARAWELQEEGKQLGEIVGILREEGLPLGTPQQVPVGAGAPATAEDQALALEKGGVPGQTPGLGELTPEEIAYLQLQMQSGQTAAAAAAPAARTQVFAGTS